MALLLPGGSHGKSYGQAYGSSKTDGGCRGVALTREGCDCAPPGLGIDFDRCLLNSALSDEAAAIGDRGGVTHQASRWTR